MPKKSQRSRGKKHRQEQHLKKVSNSTLNFAGTTQDSKNTKASQQSLFKRLWRIIKSIPSLALIATCIAYVTYVDPYIIVDITHNPPDILNTEFKLTNKGNLFTLYDTRGRLFLKKVRNKSIILQNITASSDDALYIGDIDPSQYSTAKINTLVGYKHDASGARFSIAFYDTLESAEICLFVQYSILVAHFKFDKEQKFGFFYDQKSKTDHFIRKGTPKACN